MDKIKGIFIELLDEWESAESVVINDRSINFSEDYDYLEKRRQEFEEMFNQALNELLK